ncbi:MAG: hypothetical protein AABY93_18385 [Bacteroidota bacterium]
MRKLILVLSLSVLFQSTYGQSNYVITIKGDTVRGDIKILSYDLVDKVQVAVDKKKKIYTALEAKTIFYNNEIYHSIRHDDRYQFMVLLKSGYLSLYGFRMEKQFSYDGSYLVKKDGGAMELPNLTFKKSMQEFLQDCPSVCDQIKKGELGKKKLDTLISLYNSCIDQNTKRAIFKNDAAIAGEVDIPALVNLRESIEKSSLGPKQDILDLIKDIDTKVKSDQPIPNYLIEGLKGYLADTEYKGDLEILIEALQKK